MAYFIILFALIALYTFYMGFNDGSNAIATTVATRAMKPKTAVYLAAASKFIAPIAMFFLIKNFEVANTISNSIISQDAIQNISPAEGFIFLLSGLLAALIWGLICYFTKMPNSSSHTLLGGIIGAGAATYGIKSICWAEVGGKIILMAFLAPIISIIVGFILMKLTIKAARVMPYTINWVFKFLQKVNVIVLSSSIAINNIQKSIGIYMLIGLAIGMNFISVPLWAVITFGATLTVGLLCGGYRIIHTIGNKICKLSDVHSVVCQATTGLIVFSSSALGVPVSTGQVVASSIMGVGAAQRLNSVRWDTAKKIFISWFLTFPIAFALGYALLLFAALFI